MIKTKKIANKPSKSNVTFEQQLLCLYLLKCTICK